MLVVPSAKGQLLFVTTRRGTTGDMVQRHLFRYYSMHVAGNAGESAKSIGDSLFLLRRCSPLQATRFYFYRTFPRFAGWWALFLFSDTAVDRIPHFLILRFSPGGSANFSRCRAIARSLAAFCHSRRCSSFCSIVFIWQKKRRPNGRQ